MLCAPDNRSLEENNGSRGLLMVLTHPWLAPNLTQQQFLRFKSADSAIRIVNSKNSEEEEMKKLSFLFAFLCVAAIAPNGSFAADTFYTCTVVMCGPGPTADQVYIALTDTAGNFTQRWFTANTIRAKEMLATAMFAIANGKQVMAGVPATASYSPINSLFIVNK